MEPDEVILRQFGERVGYDESELEAFRASPHRMRFLTHLSAAAPRYTIEAEVVECRHCNSGYRVGDKFTLDVDGNFLAKQCPKRMCVYLVSQLTVPVALVNERLSEGLEPNQFHFMHNVRCLDVGLACSGYGQVMLQVQVVPRRQPVQGGAGE